jgi:hypothetical protein
MKGGPMNQTYPGGGSGISEFGQNNPVTGVLAINGKSYEFGRTPDVRSKAWRTVASICSERVKSASVLPKDVPLKWV